MITLILLIAAAICFVLAALKVSWVLLDFFYAGVALAFIALVLLPRL